MIRPIDFRRVEMPASDIIDDSSGDYVIRIPENEDDRRIMQLVESFPLRFSETGLTDLDRPGCLVSGNANIF